MSDTENRRTVPSARVRISIGAAVVLVVVALVCSVLITALSPVGATTVLTPRSVASSPPGGAGGTASATAPGAPDPSSAHVPEAAPGAGSALATDAGGTAGAADIVVHVLGSVTKPGVYRLAGGARVFDAVGLAGGFADGADQASVNLARVLTDGEQLRVLAVGEQPPPGDAGGSRPEVGGGAVNGAAGAVAGGAAAPRAKIDLNSASALDLDGLPRIGPAMAARIVDWRASNGPFTAVDDLLQVTGIGEKTLDGLRDLVTV